MKGRRSRFQGEDREWPSHKEGAAPNNKNGANYAETRVQRWISLCTSVWLATTGLQTTAAHTDAWQWTVADGHNLSVAGMGVDSRGDVYVAGNRLGSTYFGGVALASQYGGVFLCKYDAAGKLLWPKWAVLGPRPPMARAIAVGHNGHVVLTGIFEGGEATLDRIVLRGAYLTSYLARFDEQGQALWASTVAATNESWLGPGSVEPRTVAVDPAGNVYLLGQFSGTLRIGDSEVKPRPWLGSDGFLARFDATGHPLWAINSSDAWGLAVDAAGNSFLSGAVMTSQGMAWKARVFVAKYSPNGAQLWMRQSSEGQHFSDNRLAVDGEGHCLLAGALAGEIQFDHWDLTSGDKDVFAPFMVKFDPAGHVLWARTTTATWGFGLTVDPFNRPMLFGQFAGSTAIGDVILTNAGTQLSCYVAQFDSAGSYQSALQIPASDTATLSSMAFGPTGDAYLTGTFLGSLHPGAEPLRTEYWGTMFLARRTSGLSATSPIITTPPVNQVAFEGETAAFTAAAQGAASLRYQWQRNGAELAGATRSFLVLTNVSPADTARYQVVIQNEHGTVTSSAAELWVNRRFSEVQMATTSGDGVSGFNDSVPDVTRFNAPEGLAMAADGSAFVADSLNHRIRRVDAAGNTTTVAGSGAAGFRDGLSHLAQFSSPRGVCQGPAGQIHVADTGNHRIRTLTFGSPASVNTLAGDGTAGYRDGISSEARFDTPADLVADTQGNLFVCELNNHTVRKVTPAGAVSTLVGNGIPGQADGPGPEARLNSPAGLAIDSTGHLYVADWGNHRIRKVTPDGHVTTLAGSGAAGFLDGPGVAARLHYPRALAVDLAGYLFVTEQGNHSIRRVAPDGSILTIAGNGQPWFRDGDNTRARLNRPGGIGLDSGRVLVVADTGNHRLRKVAFGLAPELVARPVDQQLAPGSRVILRVTAAGQAPFTYQWFHGGQPLIGETNAALSIAQVGLDETGDYTVAVSNAHGIVQSPPAVLSVASDQPPVPGYAWGLPLRTWPAVAADPDGNCFVTAGELFQLDPKGNRRWSGAPGRWTGLTVDHEGYAYALLEREQNGRTVHVLTKISNDGTALWEHESGWGPLGVDPAGSVYLGSTWSKLDRNGTLVWSRPDAYSPGMDGLIAPDRLQRVFAVQGGHDYMFLQQFDEEGSLRWRRLFSATGGSYGGASLTGMAADPEGNVYLAGTLYGSYAFGVHVLRSIGDRELFLVKCDRSGNVLWARQSGLRDATIGGLAAGAEGVYVTGMLNGPGSFGGAAIAQSVGGAFFLAKFSPAGDVVWLRNEGEGCLGLSVTVDSEENIFVAGGLLSGYGQARFTTAAGTVVLGPSFILKLERSPPGQPPVIAGSPQGQIGTSSSTVTLHGLVTRQSAAAFQWRHNGSDLTDATNQNLVLTGLDVSAAGEYTLVAGNAAGTSASLAATVQLASSPSFVKRTLPAFYAPDTPMQVLLDAMPSAAGYSVEETPPQGWVVTQVGSRGSHETTRGTITFGPVPDARPRRFTYELAPPPGQTGRVSFLGRVLQGGDELPVLGPTTSDLALFHPADVRDHVFSLSWREVEAYAEAWRKGLPWSAAPSPIPLDYVTAAGRIWTKGGIYALKTSSPPLHWLEPAEALGGPNSARLILPETFVPDEPFAVEVQLDPVEETGACAAELLLPANWQAGELDPGAEFDAETGRIRWGPFYGNAPRRLSCQVVPVGVPSAPPSFRGMASFDGTRVPYSGRSSLSLPSQLTVRIGDGRVQLVFWERPGRRFTFQSSSNLVDWQPLGSVSSSSGFFLWSEPLQDVPRFYRVTADEAR